MTKRKMRRRWLFGAGLLALGVGLVIGAEASLDPIFRARYEDQLNTLDGFSASIAGADVSVLTRTIVFHDIVIDQTNGGIDEPYFQTGQLRIDLQGTWLSKDTRKHATLVRPQLWLVKSGQDTEQLEPDPKWRQKIDGALPYATDRLEIDDGRLVFENRVKGQTWKADLSATIDHLIAGGNPESPQKIDARARIAIDKGGLVILKLRTKTDMQQPPFELALSVMQLPLKRLEPKLRRKFGVEVERGRLSVHVNARGRGGTLQGTLKPETKNATLEKAEGGSKITAKIAQKVAENIGEERFGHSPTISFTGSYGPNGIALHPKDARLVQRRFVEAIEDGLNGS